MYLRIEKLVNANWINKERICFEPRIVETPKTVFQLPQYQKVSELIRLENAEWKELSKEGLKYLNEYRSLREVA